MKLAQLIKWGICVAEALTEYGDGPYRHMFGACLVRWGPTNVPLEVITLYVVVELHVPMVRVGTYIPGLSGTPFSGGRKHNLPDETWTVF